MASGVGGTRNLRAAVGYITAQGLLVTDIFEGKHYKIRILTSTGPRVAVLARTPGTNRSLKNFEAMIRRWAKGQS